MKPPRRLLLAAAAGLLGLLPGLQGFASASQGIVQGTPFAAPPAVASSNVAPGQWMAELNETIGQRPLKQVIIPGSHDAGTYDWGDPVSSGLASAQNVDVTAQLNAGSRYLDIRAGYHNWPGDAGADYWTKHGIFYSTNVRLRQMLGMVADWANQPGHEKELVILSVLADQTGDPDPNRLTGICQEFLNRAGNRLLQPSMIPPGENVWDMSVNEIWALPNQPTIITNWDWCTGQKWPPAGAGSTPVDGFYANQCAAGPWTSIDVITVTDPFTGELSVEVIQIPMPGIIQTLSTGLATRVNAMDNPQNSGYLLNDGPYEELPGQPVGGLYLLNTQGTPSDACLYGYSLNDSHFRQAEIDTLAAVQGWYTNDQHNAQQNLNIIAGDFVQERGIVDVAIALNQQAAGPMLAIDGREPLRIACGNRNPHSTGVEMVAYPVEDGPDSQWAKRYEGSFPGEIFVFRSDFPEGDYDIRVVCTTSPNNLVSSLTFSTSDFGPLIDLSLQQPDRRSVVSCQAARDSVVLPLELTIFPTADGPNSPDRKVVHSEAGRWVIDQGLLQSDFPLGDYELTATCGSSDAPPWTATPITFRTSDLPPPPPGTPVSVVFEYTGAEQRWAVPEGVTQATFDVFGAQGGDTYFSPGGLGGRATATIPVGSQDDVWIMVGGSGESRTSCNSVTGKGGFNGGGDAGAGSGCVAGGGGASDVRINGDTLAQRVLVAGGGGGGSTVPSYCRDPDAVGHGGAGGGLTGGAGGSPGDGDSCSVRGGGHSGQGQLGQGSAGVPCYFNCAGGGGGGGYHGGGGGPVGTGGGGGSGFGPPGTAFQTGVRGSHGRVTVTYIDQGVSARITGCTTQGGGVYSCTLEVTLNDLVSANTAMSVDIGGGTFTDPDETDRPQVAASSACANTPIPSRYQQVRTAYTRFYTDFSSGGCAAGAVITFTEAVAGLPEATITQTVTVPGLGAASASVVLPSGCEMLAGSPRAGCLLETALAAPLCGAETVPRTVHAGIRARLRAAHTHLRSADGKSGRALGRFLRRSQRALDDAARKTRRAAAATKPKRSISGACAAAIHPLVGRVVAELPPS